MTEAMTSLRSLVPSLLCVAALSASLTPAAFAQGALTPPGAPAPSMKSLGEIDASLTTLTALAGKIESRIPIDTLPGDATAVRIISAPGSYFLRGNLTSPSDGVAGIRVAASGVVIDLNGFSMIGTGANSNANAVDAISGGVERVIVRNGVIIGWRTGVRTGMRSLVEHLVLRDSLYDGVSMYEDSVARHVAVYGARHIGIQTGIAESCTVDDVYGLSSASGIEARLVRHCYVRDIGTATTGTSIGIRAGSAENSHVMLVSATNLATGIDGDFLRPSRIHGCSVEYVSTTEASGTGTGLSANSVTDSTVRDVGGEGSTHRGIRAELVQNCNVNYVATSNTAGQIWGIVSDAIHQSRVEYIVGKPASAYAIAGKQVFDCVVTRVELMAGSGYGIRVETGGQARRNFVETVDTAGITMSHYGTAAENTVRDIGTGDGVGILVAANNCRLENNSISGSADCDYGIRVTGTKNFLAGNRCTGSFGGAATGATGADTPEFNIVVGNRFGSIISTFLASGEITALNPWANFSD